MQSEQPKGHSSPFGLWSIFKGHFSLPGQRGNLSLPNVETLSPLHSLAWQGSQKWVVPLF